MIHFSLDLLKLKGASNVSMSDKTKIDCNGVEIDLSSMYFLKYGVTWYEKYFGFYPAERFQESYETAKKKRIDLLDTYYISKQPCDYFDYKTTQQAFQIMGLVDFYRYEWVKNF